eukprot:15465245-Alexandrium_andersonii.AAC.1
MICESCFAVKDNLPGTDSRLRSGFEEFGFGNLSKRAPWRRTLVSHDTYVRTANHLSPWCQVSGFHLQMVWRDFMHVVYLGVGPDIAASLIWDLFKN